MGWICPTCGRENRFADARRQVCGDESERAYLKREKKIAAWEQKLWKKPFLKALWLVALYFVLMWLIA